MTTTLNCNGRLISLDKPLIMGILNLTPDSFSDGGRHNELNAALRQTEKMLTEGATILDIGGYSTRPGADDIDVQTEIDRILPITREILRLYPDALISIDTFRSEVAQRLLDEGIHLINDISGGQLDAEMMRVVGQYPVPYIVMHSRGTPQTMQQLTDYEDLENEIWQYFVERINLAKSHGIKDLILDPGFGFAKTITQNYQLFRSLPQFLQLELPLLVGISRKSMLYMPFGITPAETLPYTSALNLQALLSGAKILRVHEVAEAKNLLKVFEFLSNQ